MDHAGPAHRVLSSRVTVVLIRAGPGRDGSYKAQKVRVPRIGLITVASPASVLLDVQPSVTIVGATTTMTDASVTGIFLSLG